MDSCVLVVVISPHQRPVLVGCCLTIAQTLAACGVFNYTTEEVCRHNLSESAFYACVKVSAAASVRS